LIQEFAGTNIKVSCVYPGAIKTNIANNAKFYKSSNNQSREKTIKFFNRNIAKNTAEKAAEIIIAGIKKNKPHIMVGWDAYIYDWARRLFPTGSQKIINYLSKRKVKNSHSKP
jgi:short-subunit dehydrogenase